MAHFRIIDVRAQIDWFDARRSGGKGRTRACRSGEQPDHAIGGTAPAVPGIIVFEGRDALAPGDSWCARVRFLCTGALGPLQVGSTWLIQEGRRKLGRGRVLQVLAEYAEGRRAPTMLASYPLPH
ncbi:MAG: hypothetical protein RI920_2368 [Pseudomonadota bacterium]